MSWALCHVGKRPSTQNPRVLDYNLYNPDPDIFRGDHTHAQRSRDSVCAGNTSLIFGDVTVHMSSLPPPALPSPPPPPPQNRIPVPRGRNANVPTTPFFTPVSENHNDELQFALHSMENCRMFCQLVVGWKMRDPWAQDTPQWWTGNSLEWRSPIVGSLVFHRQRRWSTSEPTLAQYHKSTSYVFSDISFLCYHIMRQG